MVKSILRKNYIVNLTNTEVKNQNKKSQRPI